MASGTVEVVWGAPPAGGTIDERLAWLESQMADAGQQLSTLNARLTQEVRKWQADTDEEHSGGHLERQAALPVARPARAGPPGVPDRCDHEDAITGRGGADC